MKCHQVSGALYRSVFVNVNVRTSISATKIKKHRLYGAVYMLNGRTVNPASVSPQCLVSTMAPCRSNFKSTYFAAFFLVVSLHVSVSTPFVLRICCCRSETCLRSNRKRLLFKLRELLMKEMVRRSLVMEIHATLQRQHRRRAVIVH